MSRWKASRWGHYPISPQSSPYIHRNTAHVLQSRLDWVLHPRRSDIWASITSLFFGLWSKSSNNNIESFCGTTVIWHFVWIFRWHKYKGTDSQRDRGDTTLQHLTSRCTAPPHNAHSTSPGLRHPVIAQSPLTRRRLCAEGAFLERTKPASDVTRGTQMQKHAGSFPVKSVNSLTPSML